MIFNKEKLNITCILVFSIIMKMLTSCNSFLFDNSSIASDNAIFYGIGKALLNGKVLYKDIFDHKTPYIYFFNSIAAVLDFHHIGLYLLEVIVYFVTLLFIYKIIDLYINDSMSSLFGAFMFGFVLANSNITWFLRTEGYAIACLLPAFYLFLIHVHKKEKVFKASHMFIIGILACITLMTNIKASMVFVPMAIAIGIELVVEKKYIELVKVFFSGLSGVIITFIPYVIYVIFTNSLSDMCEVLFKVNAIYAIPDADIGSVYINHLESIVYYCYYFWYIFILMILSIAIVAFSKEDKKVKLVYIISVLIPYLYTSLSNRINTYYLLLFIPFFVPIYLFAHKFIAKLFENKFVTNGKRIKIGIFIIIFLVILSFVIGIEVRNTFAYARYSKKAATNIRNVIKENFGDRKDIKLLATCFDPDAYMLADMNIEYKYFIIPKIRYKLYNKPYIGQYEYIMSLDPDIIINKQDEVMEEFPDNRFSDIYYTLRNYYKFEGDVYRFNGEKPFSIFVKK